MPFINFTMICDVSGTSDRQLVVGTLILLRTCSPRRVNSILERHPNRMHWFSEELKADHCRFRVHRVDSEPPADQTDGRERGRALLDG